MPKQLIKTKRGFTIIEVVLVLAIAGLIFMMVFIALPALQRSQRDTQRTNDMSRFMTQLTQYQSNNRGAIPGSKKGTVITKYKDDGTTDAQASTDAKNWAKLYTGYLLAGGDTFEDPSGAPYQLSIDLCNSSSKQAGQPCANSVQRSESTFENGYTEGNIGTADAQNFTISVVINATCTGEQATYASGNRKVAILYKKEGGGTICESN
ncbi:type II secretion system protein [Candidatus Saccharibacteria bacterium]|nr:type II secretion system protein [Candidatus Saccharibacteria bacterium]